MTKTEFISLLRQKLSELPKRELEEQISFYSEMIDDRIEDGKSEAEAVTELGTADEIAALIISEVPLLSIAKEKIRKKGRPTPIVIALLALGSPIWLSLTASLFAVLLSTYAVLWSVIIVLWSVFASLVAVAPACILLSVIALIGKNGILGIACIGISLLSAGLAVFVFFGCKAATVGMARLSKAIVLKIKTALVRKENVQ